MAEALTAARQWTGTVRASFTKFEARIIRWKGKAELAASDHHVIQHSVEMLKEYNTDFKRSHFDVVKLLNEEKLEVEQAVLVNHKDTVKESLNCLFELLTKPEKVSKKSPATTVFRVTSPTS